MNYEELDEYSRNENLLRESRNSSPERLSSSPEEFHKSFSPLSSERETPSPLACGIQEYDSPTNTESCSSPSLYEPIKDQKKIAKDRIKQSKDLKKLTKDEKEAREEGIDKFISNYLIINMDMNELKEELNRFVSERGMTQHQKDYCLKIRKKGKNKFAAQEHRAKRMKELALLNDCVEQRERELQKNIETKTKLTRIKSEWENNLEQLCSHICLVHNKDPAIWRVVMDEKFDNVDFVLRDSRPTCL